MATVKALLFDMGGVVLGVDFEKVFHAWASISSQDAKFIKSRFRMDEHYERHERGEIDAAVFFEHLREVLQLDVTDADMTDGWNAIFGQEIAESLDAIDSISATMPVYGYTNTNRTHQLYWEQHFPRIQNTFEKVFISNEIGLRKPDAEAFEFVLKEIGVQAEELLFFDDSIENCEGAKVLGIQTVLVTDASSVVATLAELK